MQQDTQQRTSQGEFIASGESNKPAQVQEEGLLSSLWHKVVGTTGAAAHKAEDAVHAIQESTAALLDKGLEKAHDAIIAGEEFVALETKKAASLLSDVKPSDAVEKAQTTAVDIDSSIQEFASIIMEQAKELHAHPPPSSPQPSQGAIDALVAKAGEVLHSLGHMGAEMLDTASEKVAPAVLQTKSVVIPIVDKAVETATPVVEKAKEVAAPIVDKVMEVAAPVVEKVMETAAPVAEKAKEVIAPMKRSSSNRSLKRSSSKQSVDAEYNNQELVLTMDIVSHVQRIADRTGDAVLHETARRAHSACAKGLSEAPGVHLVWITPQQANDLVNLAIRTQDHELADFARYCQSVAATTHVGVEPTPGKIQEEIQKGHEELQKQGRVHTGPGYGAAFASVNKTYPATEGGEPLPLPISDSLVNTDSSLTLQKRSGLRVRQESKMADLELTMDVVSHVQRIADRTGNSLLHDTARKAHSAFAKGLHDAPGVHLTRITPVQASELMNIASKTNDKDIIDFARYCQSVASTTQVGVEPTPGKIQEELFKAHDLQQQQVEQQQQQLVQALPALE